MENIQQRIQARLGFVNMRINKQWRLYWNGRHLFNGDDSFHDYYGLDAPFKEYRMKVMTIDGERMITVTIEYQAPTGFKVALTGNFNHDELKIEGELDLLLLSVRDRLKNILDSKLQKAA